MSSYKYRIKGHILYSDTQYTYKDGNRFSRLLMFRALKLPFCLLLPLIALLVTSWPVSGAEISGPVLTTRNSELFVEATLTLDDKYLQELRNGMKKEFHFYIDLYRVWDMWSDEFITGKQFIRKLKSDPVKTEFVATSSNGSIVTQKRFKSFESMIRWALSIENERLTNISALVPGTYYVRFTVESKIRQLPPVIGYFMIFVKENEFTIRKDSPQFTTGSAK